MDDYNDEDIAFMTGEKKIDIKNQMAQIAIDIEADSKREKLKCRNYGPGVSGSVTDRNGVNPIEFLKDLEFRRSVQGPFKSQTREQYNKAFTNKSINPEVAKYTPRYGSVDTN
jgi:hypothetical protein